MIHSKPLLNIFRTQDIQDTVNLENTVYTEPCVSLYTEVCVYSQPLYIQDLVYPHI